MVCLLGSAAGVAVKVGAVDAGCCCGCCGCSAPGAILASLLAGTADPSCSFAAGAISFAVSGAGGLSAGVFAGRVAG